MATRQNGAIGVVMAALALWACNAILGLESLEPYHGNAAAADAGASDADPRDAIGDASPAGEAGSVGEIVEAPCDASEVPPTYGAAVYVSQKTGQPDASAANGEPLNPFATINAALGPAKALGAKTIVLDEGTYAESIEIKGFSDGLRVDGAWIRTGATWERDCAAGRRGKTLLQAPTTIAVRVVDQAARVAFTNLTIVTGATQTTAPNVPGASRIGVFSVGSVLALEGVLVRAAAGDPGGSPSGGDAGAPLCVSSASCPQNGAPGASGVDAPPAPLGSFEPAGFSPGNGGEGAEPGGNGANGSPGGAANSRSDCEVGCDGNGTCDSALGTRTSGPGQCGCGGAGGSPGRAGRGGGASVALLAAGGTVSVKWSELVAERGGDGSPGGAGGSGGNGTAGVGGASKSCWSAGCCEQGICPSSCGCYAGHNWNTVTNCTQQMGFTPVDRVIPGGGPGGAGKSGGRGSNGGGGAGGPSFAFVAIGGAQVLVADSKRTFGAGGNGAGGAPGGPTGERFP